MATPTATSAATKIRATLTIAATVSLLAACSGAHTATSSSAAPRTPPSSTAPTHGPYVALGDSYTSGPAIPEQVGTPVGCQRSSRDYPALVAQGLKLTTNQLHDVSCSGATTADLSAPQSTSDGSNAAQLAALSSATTLVTLGIGGNDVDFAGVLARCVRLDLIPALLNNDTSADVTPCHAYYTSTGPDQIQQKIQTAAARVANALAQIKTRAPHARVYVIGYPALLPTSGAACAHTLGITQGDVAFLNTEERSLNDMLRQRAQSAGASYVDTYTPSVGHDACSAATTRWIEPLLIASPAEPLHPNARGEQGMATAILRALTTTSTT
jgi:lysophospholipase L1-like esterase